MNLEKNFASQLKIYLVLVTTAVLLSLLTTGCKDDSTSSNATPGPNEIFMQNSSFTPANKTISVGTTITWKNQDGTTHTVTSGVPGNPSGVFNSGNLGNGGTFPFTFNNTGEFKYFCNIHNSMTGTITVQ